MFDETELSRPNGLSSEKENSDNRFFLMNNPIRRHAFTAKIEAVLERYFGKNSGAILRSSPLLCYLNEKTRSAGQGAKARGSFANHYALYVLIEDYLANGFGPEGRNAGQYASYEGARFSDLLRRQRELPFGSKLQNHGLNGRLNDEFKKYFPVLDKQPVVRNVETQRYWIHEDLLVIALSGRTGKQRKYHLGNAVIEIIDAYVDAKKQAFELFIESCRRLAGAVGGDAASVVEFVKSQLKPEVDARIFEIVSFAVLKAYYSEKFLFWGWSRDSIKADSLQLFKTGRTNANDGGIDFVMRPLGRFFQVTETVDAGKYFLDIDKIQRFPLTFVVKSEESEDSIRRAVEAQAQNKYRIASVVENYMNLIEEVFNIPRLLSCLESAIESGKTKEVMSEIVLQSTVEFNCEVVTKDSKS